MILRLFPATEKHREIQAALLFAKFRPARMIIFGPLISE